MNIEQIKEILANAPDNGFDSNSKIMRSLYETILAQHEEIAAKAEEIERLKAVYTVVAVNEIENAANVLASMITVPPGKYSSTVMKLKEIVNQLREQSK